MRGRGGYGIGKDRKETIERKANPAGLSKNGSNEAPAAFL